MKTPHLLNLPNPRKVKQNLAGILSAPALSAIEAEINRNAVDLHALGMKHYQFAIRHAGRNWRQKVSRLYYAAYNVTRAIRLFVSGDYSTDVKDHQKFDSLPNDFPNRERYVNQMAVLREDRNTCDYDHTAKAADLVLSSTDAAALVAEFLKDSETYLSKRGLQF
jgi:hypothetical protein